MAAPCYITDIIFSKEGDNMKRVFLTVLDSFGIGELSDAASFGDLDVNTLRSVCSSKELVVPNLTKLGLFNMDGTEFLNLGVTDYEAMIARMREASKGKDTTIGHWEIAGLISPKPMPTYPNGFPQEVLDAFSKATGRGVLCNKTYSGTDVIRDYGDEHVNTGDLIVYTSADSVFQIAAHEDIVPCEQLYEYCKMAREILQGEHAVGRVIARPFIGHDGDYQRTPRRHDFSLVPPKDTMLDILKNAGKDVIGVGKIYDIFAGKGMTDHVYTSGNTEGIQKIMEYLKSDFEGLCFINLVDFDMLYGHRRDIDGYAKALSEFDAAIPQIKALLGPDDVFMITADHGCDPAYLKTTDHTREHTPFIMFGPSVKAENLGTRDTFADIAATILECLSVKGNVAGESMLL